MRAATERETGGVLTMSVEGNRLYAQANMIMSMSKADTALERLRFRCMSQRGETLGVTW